MAELTAVPTQLLTDIADKIREKRDITDSIPVPDMAMQIGLISGGSEYIDIGTITFSGDQYTASFPLKQGKKVQGVYIWLTGKAPFVSTSASIRNPYFFRMYLNYNDVYSASMIYYKNSNYTKDYANVGTLSINEETFTITTRSSNPFYNDLEYFYVIVWLDEDV